MNNRILLIALFLVAIVGLSACGSSERASGPSKDDYRASQDRSHGQAQGAVNNLE